MNTPKKIPPWLLAVICGGLTGALITLMGLRVSPLLTFMGMCSLAVAVVVFINPILGFFLATLVIPIERLGRFTDDASMYTISLMRFVGLLALAAFLLHAFVKRERIRFGFPFFLYTLYFCLCALTVTYTTDFLGTVRACGAIVGNLLFFFLIINIARSWKVIRIAILLWLIASVFIGLYTIYDWHIGGRRVTDESKMGTLGTRFSTAWQDKSEWQSLEQVSRAMGSTSHAAVYGINLIMTLPFFVYLMRLKIHLLWKVLLMIAMSIIAYNILLTNTRAAILLAGLVIVFCFFYKLIRLKASTLVVICIIAAGCLPFIPGSIYKRVLDIRNYTPQRSHTLRIRLDFWNAGLQVLEENWVKGVGVGNRNEVPKYLKILGPQATTVHNEYLQTFMEVGILGWLLFFGFIAILLGYSIRTGSLLKKTRGDPEKRLFVAACQIAMIAVLIYGLQVDVFHFPLKGWWLIAGLSYVLYQITQQESRKMQLDSQEGATTA